MLLSNAANMAEKAREKVIGKKVSVTVDGARYLAQFDVTQDCWIVTGPNSFEVRFRTYSPAKLRAWLTHYIHN